MPVSFVQPVALVPALRPASAATKVVNNLTWFRDTMPDAVTLPQHFREHGYYTAKTGKIFHEGLDDPKAWDFGGTPHQVLQAKKGDDKKARQARADRWVKVEGEGENEPDYKIATQAVEFLEKKHDKPFFIAVDSTSRTCRSSRPGNTSISTIRRAWNCRPISRRE